MHKILKIQLLYFFRVTEHVKYQYASYAMCTYALDFFFLFYKTVEAVTVESVKKYSQYIHI